MVLFLILDGAIYQLPAYHGWLVNGQRLIDIQGIVNYGNNNNGDDRENNGKQTVFLKKRQHKSEKVILWQKYNTQILNYVFLTCYLASQQLNRGKIHRK